MCASMIRRYDYLVLTGYKGVSGTFSDVASCALSPSPWASSSNGLLLFKAQLFETKFVMLANDHRIGSIHY